MPDVQPSENEIIRQTKFRLTVGQGIFSVVVAISLVIFGISTFTTSRDSLSQAKVLSDAETPAASIIFTQRETLVYATRYSEWLAGGVARRDVQIARALLSQRLSVVDGLGTTIGSRLTPLFLQALKMSDSIVASTHPGFLTLSERASLAKQSVGVIDSILFNSRQLIESYQHAVDEQIQIQVLSRARSARINLALLIWIIASALLLFLWVGSTVRRQYRRGRIAIRKESLAMEQMRDQLLRTQESLVAMQSLNEAKNEFISTVNHELRTPLTSIIGYIELLRKRIHNNQDAAELVPLIDTVDRNAMSLLDLVESMLSISKLDAKESPQDFRKIDLVENMENVVFVLEPAFTQKSLKLNIDGAREKFIIDGNYGQVTQIFMNILSNAIKFSNQGSAIDIVFTKQSNGEADSYLCVTVKDYGIGIPEEDMSSLFTRFFRARNAVSEHISGTGLGLAIVEKLVLIHGGTIEAKSVLGKGTEMQTCFPQAASRVEKMILERRGDVLLRSIEKIVQAKDLAGAAHEIGGAIGFYGCAAEGDEILNISRNLKDYSRIEDARTRIIEILRNANIENEEK